MRVAVISDDLTGAADTGVQLTRAGYRTAVAFHCSPIPPEQGLDAVALDTDSRAMPAGFAARRVVESAHEVRETRIVYKKLDSTLRGNVAAELAAALGATGREVAVVAPAFPGGGRTTVNGVQLVHGTPVHETEAKSDPRTPVSEGHLPTLLAEAAPPVAALSVKDLSDPASIREALANSGCVVADAEREEDLVALVRAVPDPSTVLWAGSAGLAGALGAVYPGPRAGEQDAKPEPARAVLVVAGSLSGVTREQLRRLTQEYEDAEPVVAGSSAAVEEAVRAARAALAGRGCAVVCSSEERDGSGEAGSVVEALAEVAAALNEEGLFDALVLTGGDTAVGVARRLGATGIRLAGEVEPGVPMGALISAAPYRVVTKAGGFGGPETLVEAVKALLGGGKE